MTFNAESLQPGILKPTGRNHIAYLFIRAPQQERRRKKFRKWLSCIMKLQSVVYTAAAQERQTAAYKQCPADERVGFANHQPVILNVGFTYSGFKNLRRKTASDAGRPTDDAWQLGMAARKKILNDYEAYDYRLAESVEQTEINNRRQVEPDYLYYNPQRRIGKLFKEGSDKTADWQRSDIDLVVILSHDLRQNIEKAIQRIRATAEEVEFITHSFVETGHVQRNEAGRPVSPLGFADGFSTDQGVARNFRTAFKGENWRSEPDNYGTYLAFRKITVNAKHFEKYMVKPLSKQLKKSKNSSVKLLSHGEKEEYARALLMGRFRNGSPLAIASGLRVLAEEEWQINGQDLPFDYGEDSSGGKCPFHAHVRSANPRIGTNGYAGILRRGYCFATKQDEHGGLLFASYQASILDQFENVVRNMNGQHKDVLIYRPPRSKIEATKATFSEIDLPAGVKGMSPGMYDLTNFRGGGYFYMPSVNYLRQLTR